MTSSPPRRGQAMLEFALVFPLIVLIIVLFIELGRVVYYYSALTNAVREGARFASVQMFTSTEERLTVVRDRVSGFAIGMPLADSQITLYCDQDVDDSANPCEDYITVEAAAEIEPMAVFVARLIGPGNTYGIHASSTMQMTPWGSQEP